ncbi:unnamed protein product [Adineta steineri]|uniref:G-protein coupled receptors family 1 profile domain-containing protein n=1 Tax=Adineta steineri TaxID=433720 RepID=A0A815BWD7_9BILA|nr:unnamed protein product [Adineta steineri]
MELVVITTDWICVILFILGFIGNLLGLVVFSSRRFRCCSTYAILSLTSFSINLICIIRYTLLLHSTTRRWLSDNIVSTYWLTCKIYRLSSSFRVLAAWVTVFWVIERFIYVTSRLHLFNLHEKSCFLKKYKFLCMIIISLIMVFIVTGPTVFFFSPNLAYFNETHTTIQCTFNEQHVSLGWKNYFENPSFGFNYHTIRCLFSELIPSLLVALFNIGIITCILCTTAHVKRRRQQHNLSNHLSMSIGTISTTKIAALSPTYQYDRNQNSQRHSSLKGSTQIITNVPFGKMSWMNIVLILHSLLFFLSSSMTSLLYFSTDDFMLAHWVSVIILATCSLNFYVYCLSGRQFRKELKRIAKHYIRHIRKIFIPRCYIPNRRSSSTQNGKNTIYQQVYQTKYRNSPVSPCVRPYPIRQVV